MASESSKAIQMLLIVACMAMQVATGLAHRPEPVLSSELSEEDWQQCWTSVTNIAECVFEIYRSFTTGQTGFGPDCCEAVAEISENCWCEMVPSIPFFSQIIRSYCGIPTSQSGAPAPEGISPSDGA